MSDIALDGGQDIRVLDALLKPSIKGRTISLWKSRGVDLGDLEVDTGGDDVVVVAHGGSKVKVFGTRKRMNWK